MAKIARKAQKIFASTAGFHQLAQIGSLAAASPAYSTDPDVIQALSNYLSGWFNIVIGANSPAIEDMNSLCYLFAYQLAYIFQAGVPEWNAGTTYYVGSIVQISGVEYVSVTDTNLNNNPTGDTGSNWQVGPLLPSGAAPMTTSTLIAGSGSVVFNKVISNGQTQNVPNTSALIVYNSMTVQSGGFLTVASGGQMRVI